ncbi:MAG TPA: family 20 glycosylhydrolase, partial [Gemmatimonadaceae bacterium]|nr:family 20 glycosylhydrolase [Gemmatimonadaceae bacterium]
MRQPAILVLAAMLAACQPRTESAVPRDLPPLIPLPASFSYARGSWTPAAEVRSMLADPASASYAALAASGVASSIGGGKPESYRLTISADGVTLTGADSAGLFHGLQTLRQLVEAGPVVRAITIDDAPRFRYRGMHLDVARHFMPVEFVKRYIDLMSRHKLNTFHWHLTDDQGWRIEIKKYPKLTSVGAWRVPAGPAARANIDPA